MRVEDAYKHPKFFGAVDRETGFKTRDLLCAPIVNSDNEIVGIIQVVNSDRETGFASRGKFTSVCVLCLGGILRSGLRLVPFFVFSH